MFARVHLFSRGRDGFSARGDSRKMHHRAVRRRPSSLARFSREKEATEGGMSLIFAVKPCKIKAGEKSPSI